MCTYTFISKTACLRLKVKDKKGVCLIAELVTGNPMAMKVSSLQLATMEFKERLKMLDDLGESSYNAKKFFNDIPTNHHFFFLCGCIDDELQKNLLKKELYIIDGLPYKDSVIDEITSELYHHYKVFVFQGDQRLGIGEYDKSKRICRFCGRAMPDTNFKTKAHAISESLGNKQLFCREECDECNKRFGATIEQDIEKLFRFQLMLKGIRGKKGIPTLVGDGVSIKNDISSRKTKGLDTISLKVRDLPSPIDFQGFKQYMLQPFSFLQDRFVPQNIYKCFCKYVLSLLDRQYLTCFEDTINWIGESPMEHDLPPVWYYQTSVKEAVSMAVMIRKHGDVRLPYCWSIFNVAGYQFLFIVPFCSLDSNQFVDKKTIKYFLDGIKELMPSLKLTPICLNGVNPIKIKSEFKIDIPPDCIEGRDYYFVNL